MSKQLLRGKEVEEKLSITRTTLYRIRNEDETFPKPIYLKGKVFPYWVEEDLDNWIEKKKEIEECKIKL